MLIELLLSLSIILLMWMYIGYPLVLWLLSKINGGRIRAGSMEPKVSVVICTYNESTVINRRIENILMQDYPREKLEIIIVDSSTDKTADIIKKKWISDVMLLEEKERRGKASAINLAFVRASGEIIVLSDAPTLYNQDTIKNIVINFADPRVGGVTGKYDPVGRDKRVEEEEKLFWKFKNMLRNLEGQVDSTTFLSGELCAFRKELIQKVDENSMADDVNIAMKIRKKGYRTIYDPQAKFMEKVPANYKDFLTQKVRRAIGGIQETIRFKSMIFNPRFKLYGMLILPTRFMYTILNPFIFLTCSTAFLCVFVRTVNSHPSLILPVIGALLFIGILIFVLREGFPIKILTMFLIAELILLLAFFRYLLNDFSVKWE